MKTLATLIQVNQHGEISVDPAFAGLSVDAQVTLLQDWMRRLEDRLRHVRSGQGSGGRPQPRFERVLSDDRYRIYLSRRYPTRFNQLLGGWEFRSKLFMTADSLLQELHTIEEAMTFDEAVSEMRRCGLDVDVSEKGYSISGLGFSTSLVGGSEPDRRDLERRFIQAAKDFLAGDPLYA